MFLYWLGAKFLFFTHRMDILVMKSVSLSFISQLDELLFSAYASLSFKSKLQRSCYVVDREKSSRNWYTWGHAAAQFLIALFLTIFVVWGVFGYITRHRAACYDYFKVFPKATPVRGDEPVWTTFLKGLEFQ